MAWTRIILAIALLTTAGVGIAYAAGLASFTTTSVGGGSASVSSPPIVVDVNYITQYENGGPLEGLGYMVDEVDVTYLATSDIISQPYEFGLALTGSAPLPLDMVVSQTISKTAGDTFQIQFLFEFDNVPVEAVQDMDALVCENSC